MLRLLDAPRALPSIYGAEPSALRRISPHLFTAVHRVTKWRDGEPTLGRELRPRVLQEYDLGLPELATRADSADGSTRFVWRAPDGSLFETVWMPRHTRTPRATLCLSSQVGCAMGCTFCATGAMGIRRNLDAAEIVAQVHAALSRTVAAHGDALNVVFMGMGEPLHNLVEVHKAIRLLTDPRGLGIPALRITVSTSGLVPQINALAKLKPRPRLAVSVNATTDASRDAIMPVNRKYNLASLKRALAAFPVTKRERIVLEYVLLDRVNDTPEDAARLSEFARGLPAHINLIPLNEHEASAHVRPAPARTEAFARALRDDGHLVFVRDSRGRDVAAACGQLAATA